jgi:uncharacterized protein (TIGR02145 family)
VINPNGGAMKDLLKNAVIGLFLTSLILTVNSCKKAELPVISTLGASEITANSATSGGNITSDGGELVILRGIVWSKTQNPTLDSHEGITIDSEDMGTFESTLTGLSDNSVYYVKAYAVNNVGTAYGNQVSFNTKSINLPVLTSSQITNITLTSAKSGGIVSDDGGGEIYSKGVCWATSPNPTINDDKTNEGTGSGTFVSNLTGLQPGVTYYLRAYAVNKAGTSYGNEIIFAAKAALPELATYPISSISEDYAKLGGCIVSDGGATVSERGVCWGTSPNPTIFESYSSDGLGTGSFSSTMTGLLSGTIYYVRTYATNSEGIAYGNELTFVTYIHDNQGHVYKTIIIGTQIWMAENLQTARYNNSDLIETTVSFFDVVLKEPTAKYQWTDVPEQESDFYLSYHGRLYTWYSITDNRKVCPTNWHIPSDAEWTTLIDFLGRAGMAGDKLKEICNGINWRCIPFGGANTATNETGFTARGGGKHVNSGGHAETNRLGEEGNWWSSTESSSTNAWYRYMSWESPSEVMRYESEKMKGFSVRCVKNN